LELSFSIYSFVHSSLGNLAKKNSTASSSNGGVRKA